MVRAAERPRRVPAQKAARWSSPGDYNVIPTELDVYKPERWVDDALFLPETREAYRQLRRSRLDGSLCGTSTRAR